MDKDGKEEKNNYKLKLCVSGAAETGHCGLDAFEKGKELGREIVRQGGILTTGATTGFPFWSATGAKEEGGLSIGFSPASTEEEHLQFYKLPLDYMDVMVYTGFGYSGRNLILTRSADAVFIGCGRIGTINEFTVAYEDGKPIGILEGDWETDEVLKHMLDASNRTNDKIIFDSDPKKLVARVIEKVIQEKESHGRIYRNHGSMGIPNPEDLIK
ncbi:LOG family protein [bacterium]|nr:LOG family protein [bacterium]MBT3730102.1 LOG family protein [bacterium]MBT4894687.1 LOG family protein [bacterium]